MNTDKVRKIREIKEDEAPFLVNPESVCCGFLLIPKQMTGLLTNNHINQALQQNKPHLWAAVIQSNPSIPLLLITTEKDIDAADAVSALEANDKYKDHSIALDIMRISPDGGRTLLDVYVGFTFKTAVKEVVIAGKDKILPREYLSNADQEKKTNVVEDPGSHSVKKWWKFWKTSEKSSEKLSGEATDLNKPQHKFKNGVCTNCSLSETAVKKFGWGCKPDKESPKSPAGSIQISAKEPIADKINEKLRADFSEAVVKGDLQSVKNLLAKGVNINEPLDGRTALHQAASAGHTDILKILLDAGADISARDRGLFSQGADALYLASVSGQSEVVRELLTKGAKVDSTEDNGWTSLIKAAQLGNVPVARMLLDFKADVNIRSKDGTTPILVAAQQGHAEIVKMLLDGGAYVDTLTNDRSTPLMQAAQQGHFDVVKLLLINGANVNARRDDNVSALYLASYNGHTEIAGILLDSGADVNAKTNDNVTALYTASGRGHSEIVIALIQKGADINSRNTIDEWTPLIRASDQGHLEIVKILLLNGADINVQDRDGWTAMVAASKKGHNGIVKLLKESAAY